MRKYILLMGVLILAGACSTLPDSHKTERKTGIDANLPMDHASTFFVARKGIEGGFEVIFHVMPAPEGEKFSRVNYHLMVSVEKNGQPITNLKLYSDVKHPDGSSEAKAPMMRMGDWYMTIYNLSHEQGRHWVTVSFELAGITYSSGVYYPERIVQ